MRRAHQASAAVAALLWLATIAAQSASSPWFAATWLDLDAVLAGGEPAFEVAMNWGLRSRAGGDSSGERQQRADACGPAALCVALRARGLPLTQDLAWCICRAPGGGTTLGRLARTARRFGCTCEVRRSSRLDDLPRPAIVHLRRGHFVVLQPDAGRCARIFDPACGDVRLPWGELRRRASGAALVFGSCGRDSLPRGSSGRHVEQT